MNRAERRAQMRERIRAPYRDCRGGTPWPPPVRNTPASQELGRPRSAAPAVSRGGSNRSIALHIEEVVLHGFPARGRHAVGDAVQVELGRLLSTTGLPEFVTSAQPSGGIDGGTFHVNPHTKPSAIGKLIANAVYGGRRR